MARLAGNTLRAAASGVAGLQRDTAGRVLDAIGPAAAPVRRGRDLVAAAGGLIGGTVGGGARLAGLAAAKTASGVDWDRSTAARKTRAVLNGLYGNQLERAVPGLAAPMVIRRHARDVPPTRVGLAAAFPDATGSIVVFLHGLTDNEESWEYHAQRHHGQAGVTYGSLLQRDLGMTPVYLRYNTGLHISDNGAYLDALIARLAANWPVPVRGITLIGHSMGGLVARSALHHARGGAADGRPWTRLVRDTVSLGTPHLGAPLERGAHRLTGLLQRRPGTRPLARVLAARSAGIKDLRHGTLVAADWQERDLDAAGSWPHTHVPLHLGARHHVVLATLARDPGRTAAGLIGDLLVSPRSAYGDTGDDQRLVFPADHVRRIGRIHHRGLLNHPLVYQQLRDWLSGDPAGVSGPGAPRVATPAGGGGITAPGRRARSGRSGTAAPPSPVAAGPARLRSARSSARGRR